MSNQVTLIQNENEKKQFTLKNVTDYRKLNLQGKGVDFEVFSTSVQGDLLLKCRPLKKEVQTLSIFYDGQHVKNTPIRFEKILPEVEHNQEQNIITVKKVNNPQKLKLSFDKTLKYETYEDTDDKNTFHIKYYNPGNFKNSFTLMYSKYKVNKSPVKFGSVDMIKPGTLLISSQPNGEKVETKSAVKTDTSSKLGSLLRSDFTKI